VTPKNLTNIHFFDSLESHDVV